jgi:hypothetical protein
MVETKGLSRRGFLRSGVIGVGVIALAGIGLGLQRSKLIAVPKDGLRTFTPEHYAIFSAIALRCCPPASHEPGKPAVLGASSQGIDVALLADRLLEFADDDAKAGVGMALNVLESGVAGALFGERTAPFTQLSSEDQDRVLYAFSVSKVGLRRTIYRSLSGLSGFLYYGDPRSWPSTGYPGPPSPSGLRAAYAPQLVDLQALRAKV